MTQVALIRAGATVYDEQERVAGVLDLPLCERGRAEASTLSEKLSVRPGLTSLYCGPSACAVQTADIIGKALGLRPKVLDELRNLDQGLWQGLQIDEIKRRSLKVFRQWVEDPRTVCPPQGETIEDAMERVSDALKPVIKRHRGERFGLVLADPCARIVASYLRQDDEVHLDEHARTGDVEWIEVSPAICRNGRPV